MLWLCNDQILLLTVLALYTGLLYNDHLSITIAEISSPKWSFYRGLTVYEDAKYDKSSGVAGAGYDA